MEDGFDFLGQHLRKYAGKLLIKPARKHRQTFLGHIREMALITAPATLCPLSLPHGSPRRTEGGRWYRDRVQYRGKQGARLLPEKSLRCSCPI
jgi:hypothetical protein